MVNTVLDKTKHHMSDKVMGLDVGNIDESVSAILINALLVARGFAEDECGVARTDGTEAGTFTDKSGD
jgi:hypothetical protein